MDPVNNVFINTVMFCFTGLRFKASSSPETPILNLLAEQYSSASTISLCDPRSRRLSISIGNMDSAPFSALLIA
ncbi:unnamed protein product [Agarophyton chilense]